MQGKLGIKGRWGVAGGGGGSSWDTGMAGWSSAGVGKAIVLKGALAGSSVKGATPALSLGKFLHHWAHQQELLLSAEPINTIQDKIPAKQRSEPES